MSDIIRAYELKRHDLFVKQGTLYLVVRVTNEGIVYSFFCRENEWGSGRYCTIGRWSQERVEYIGKKPKKKKTKPFKYESNL